MDSLLANSCATGRLEQEMILLQMSILEEYRGQDQEMQSHVATSDHGCDIAPEKSGL